jgi:hypothetical protein
MTTQPGETSPAWALRLIADLGAADERATALAKTLTPHQLNWRRHPDEWSVGQCLDHLRISNEVYLRAISESLVEGPPAVVQEITPGWFGRWFIRNYIEPNGDVGQRDGATRPRRRANAPGKIAPSSQVGASILDEFLRSNEHARKVIHRARQYDVNRIRFKNPFVSWIRFTVGTGFVILTTHQRRHLLQAERVRGSAKFPQD